MNFTLTEEQRIWQKSVHDFADKELASLVETCEKEKRYPLEIVPKMAALKLWGVFVPEEYGGAGGDNMDWVIMMEEVGRVSAAMGISVLGHCHATRTLLVAGSEAQKKKYLPPLAGDGKIAAFGLTEPNAGSDVANIETTATKRGDNYYLNGAKAYITNFDLAEMYVIFAKTDKAKGRHGISGFIVEKDTPGFSFGKKESLCGLHSGHTGELIFEDCSVPQENLIGDENEAFRRIIEVFGLERMGNSAISVGTAQAALDAAIQYTKDRPAFGRHVADFQGVQWMLADMAIDVEAARLMVRQGADYANRGLPHLERVAMAKTLANEAAMRVTEKAMQLFGAVGYNTEFPIERYFRDAKMFALGGGTTQIMRNIVARGLLGKS